MKKVKILSKPTYLTWGALILGFGVLLIAIFQIFSKPGFTYTSDYSGYLNLLLGTVNIWQFFYLKKFDRFFIKVEGDSLEWFLPGMAEPLSVSKRDLIGFEASWKDVQIKTRTEEISIPLKDYEWDQSKKIRTSFQEFAN